MKTETRSSKSRAPVIRLSLVITALSYDHPQNITAKHRTPAPHSRILSTSIKQQPRQPSARSPLPLNHHPPNAKPRTTDSLPSRPPHHSRLLHLPARPPFQNNHLPTLDDSTILFAPPWHSVIPFASEFGLNIIPQTPVFVDVGGENGQQCKIFRAAFPELEGRVVLQGLDRVIEYAGVDEEGGVERMVYDYYTEQAVKGESN